MAEPDTSKPNRFGSLPGSWRLLAVAVAVAGLFVWSQSSHLPQPFREGGEAFVVWLKGIPLWAYLACFATLPAVGFPLSVFYLTVAVVVDGLAAAVVAAWCCMAANMALSFVIARTLSSPVRRLTERRGYRLPRVGASSEWKLVVAMRASPLPWLMQSYLLALAGVRFGPYLAFGVPVQALIGFGLIVLGESLYAADVELALIGLAATAAVLLVLALVRRRASPPA